MARITINGVSLDPESPAPAVMALSQTNASKSNYILIQTNEPLKVDQKTILEGLGVSIGEYVSENTYLCSYAPADLGPVRNQLFVAWAGVYHNDFKIPPTLRPPVNAMMAANIGGPAFDAFSRRTLKNVDVVFHDNVATDDAQLKSRIAAAARISPDDLKMGRHKVRLHVQERYLPDVAAIDEVRNVDPAPSVKLFNNIARSILKSPAQMNGTTLSGEGQIIVVNDTGFDMGSTVNVHPAFTGRVLKLNALGRMGRADDPDGHGTHVAGSALGNGNSAAAGGVIQGTAPEATLILQSLLDANNELGGIPPDLHDLFEPPYRNDNARIHTNSWGSTQPGLPYSQSSNEIDDFVWTHHDCVICFAAGNDGIDGNSNGVVDPGSIGSESAAKNCITVGASENDRAAIPLTYGTLRATSWPVNPIAGDQTTNNPNGMAAFSSRGPTKERRYKPDVVAPGTSILSTRSRAVANVPTIFGSSTDNAYFFDAGTSMATPLVAGCVAILRESLARSGTPSSSAALIKALLINGAVTLQGQYHPSEAGVSPNNSSGWGRVDLAGSIVQPGHDPARGFQEGAPLSQGQENSIEINIVPNRIPNDPHAAPVSMGALKVTLVWTDPPGALLQNDLDLIVKAANGEERHGNMGTLQGFDRVNNVEQVCWHDMPVGPAQLIVRAFRITRFAQPWALVWRIG